MTGAERLHALVHDAVLDLPDADGRWLGESHAQAVADLDPAPCPYAGSRAGGTMHRAPWQQAVRHLDAVCALLTAHSGPTAGHAWRATCRLRWGPLWGPRPVPALASAAHKTALGLERPLSSWLLLTPGAAARPLHDLVPVDGFVERLDQEGWLVGRRSVCPASPRALARTWAALHAPEPPAPNPADAAPLWISGVWAVLGAARRLHRDGCDDLGAGAHVDALLGAGGPGALVREVPWFEPPWALHVWEAPPSSLLHLVDRAEAATRLRDLDEAWATFLDDLG